MSQCIIPLLHHAHLLSIASIVVIYSVTFGVLLPEILHDWPYSPYYRGGTQDDIDVVRRVVQANDRRLSDANQYLQSLPKIKRPVVTSVGSVVDMEHYDLVIVVITMNRMRALMPEEVYNLGYLTQTVARLLQIAHTDNTARFRRKKLILCNVDLRPQNFTEALWLSDYVQTISRFQNYTTNQQGDAAAKDKFEKEKVDYVYCLRTATGFSSPYYLILEDDVLLDENAIESLYFVMSYFHLFSAVDWLFLKLYYPEKWSGYGRNWQTVVEIGGYAVLGGFLLAAVVMLIRKHRTWTRDCGYTLVWVWFAVGAVFTALLCVSIGRQYVESWRHNSASTHRLVTAPGCCTQAILYPSRIVSDLCAHLSRVHCDHGFSVDIAIDGFAHIRGLKRHLVEPNVVKHIGLVSNFRRAAKAAQHFL